jgi:hypothetical protein
MMAVWLEKFYVGDVFHADIDFEEKRDIIVERIRLSGFFFDDDMELIEAVESIEEAEDHDEFNYGWDLFYDWCDINRVWVDTISVSA